jgi:hypothetical protein
MKKLCDLRGHTSRVLHLALSPDGTTIASAAADETLRFWKVFQQNNNHHGLAMGTGASGASQSAGGGQTGAGMNYKYQAFGASSYNNSGIGTETEISQKLFANSTAFGNGLNLR